MVSDSPTFLPAALLHRPVYLSGGGFICHILTFIVEIFTFTKAECYLYPAALEIKCHRYKGEPLLLDLAEKAHYLALMQQQLSYSQGVAVKDIALLIGGDMHSLYPHLTVIDRAPRIL